MVAIAALALAVHLFARVAVGDHWLTDVLGAYLLVAGVALLADRLRPGDT
jgi:membrane-associated phospholipid phosphatase